MNPYSELKYDPLWEKVAGAIDDLSQNKDLSITTNKDLVIGYIVKKALSKD